MAKAKFDQEAAFKSIIGIGEPEADEKTGVAGQTPKKAARKKEPVMDSQNADRVQRAYYLDRDIVAALKIKSAKENENITEIVNALLRQGLADYL